MTHESSSGSASGRRRAGAKTPAQSVDDSAALAPGDGELGDHSGEIFVGRERELRDLGLAIEAALAGRGKFLLLAGEPGIGKTRLASEAAREAGGRGAEVLWGRCWDGGGAPPFWPWVQIMRAHALACPAADLARHLAGGAALIAEIVPELRDLFPDLPRPAHPSDSEEARFRLFDAMGVCLRNASLSRALLLILDDLQWADEPSLVLLQFLARGLADSRILLLGAYRTAEAKMVPLVARRLGALASDARVIPLRGLGSEEVRFLVERSGGQAGDEPMADAVHRATGGNPLFVVELIRLLAAEGRLTGPQPVASLPIPERVREVIRRRASLVSGEVRRILSVAAVIGRDFDPVLLQQVVQTPRQQVHGLLSEAHAAELVVETAGAPGRFSFAHDLVRETLYDDLAYDRRLEHHRAIADALEHLHSHDLDAHLAEVARHLFEAIPLGTTERAIHYSTRAADQAAQRLAYEEAVIHYERALQALALAHPTDERQRCRVWLSLGDARWWAGRLEDSRAAFLSAAEAAEALGAPVELARAAIGFGSRDPSFGVGLVDDRLIRLLEKALRGLDEGDSSLRALLTARLAGALTFSPDRQRGAALARSAVEMARRIGDKPALHYALNASVFATWGPDNLAERLAVSAEIVRLGNEIGEAALVGSGYRVTHLMEAGDVAAAERERLVRSAHALRCRFCTAWLGVGRTASALLEGRFDEVEGLTQSVLAALREVQNEHGEQHVVAQQLLLRREQGQLADVVDTIRRFLERYPALPTWRAALGWTYAELGRENDARRELERLAGAGFEDVPRDMTWLICMTELAELVVFLGDAPRAERLYTLLLPFAGRCVVGIGVCLGSASRSLACLATTLARFGDARRHFEAALEENARLRSPPWVAHTRHEYARMLIAQGEDGDRDKAIELLAGASQTARMLGMRSLLDKAETLQRAMGEAARAVESPPATAAPARSLLFRREGEYWTVADEECVVRMRDAKGLRYIAALLRHPGREFYAGDLIGSASGAPGRGEPPHDSLGDAGPLLDDKSTNAYRARLAELRERLEEAEANNDAGGAAQARAEIDFLARELSSAIGLGGRRRRAGAAPERARLVVTKAIRASLKKIERDHPRLGRLLARTIRTGTFCAYRPDPDSPVVWQL